LPSYSERAFIIAIFPGIRPACWPIISKAKTSICWVDTCIHYVVAVQRPIGTSMTTKRVGQGRLVNPTTPNHELVLGIANVGNRPTKAVHAQPSLAMEQHPVFLNSFCITLIGS
jgi:hypothetical protein